MNQVKVAIIKVINDDVEGAVLKAIELLGGIENFILQSEKVLLKPNLLSAPKDENTKAKIRTEPRVLEALIKLLLKHKKSILIGDTCGQGHPGGTRSVIKESGYLIFEEKYHQVEVRSLEQNGAINTTIEGKRLMNANISKEFLEAKAVINVPKMKTHGLTIFTGAIKNLYGTICGADKTRIHSVGGTLKGFSQCLVDLYKFEKNYVQLHLMDAITALEGMGPGVTGKAVKMNLILASEDAVALDATAFRLMGHNPKKVPTITLAAEQGLGQMDEKNINILGGTIEEFKRTFKLPKTTAFGWLPFARFTNLIMKLPNYKKGCIGCRSCERACPKEVIMIIKDKNGDSFPKINYKGCISCFTCIEICPEACFKTKSKYLKRILALSLNLLIIVVLVTTLLLVI